MSEWMSSGDVSGRGTNVFPMRWIGEAERGALEMIDQRELPRHETIHTYRSAAEVAGAIRAMVVRGAPAIGIAAAYGVALGLRELVVDGGSDWSRRIPQIFDMLASTRPTAVNLFWALSKMRGYVEGLDASSPLTMEHVQGALDLAEAIRRQDLQDNLSMGRHGAALFESGARILTHCNTGGLATAGYGTALGVIREVHAEGKLARVYVDETRPYLQGARLTAWECVKDALPATLITDSMAAHFMQRGQIDAVIVGADRIAKNGDTANKIGTYGLAVLCAHHDIPFYVAAPWSTIDLETRTGQDIPIEQRSAREVTHVGERALAPEGIEVAHPAFDITPGHMIRAIITERGVAVQPYIESLDAIAAAHHAG